MFLCHSIRRFKCFLPILVLSLSAVSQAQQYWVSSFSSNQIDRFDTAGNHLGTISGIVSGPQGIVRHTDGLVYVADENNDRVVCFDSNGNFVKVFVTPGSGGLDGPTGLSFNANGELLVASFNTDSVIRYDANGNHLGTFVTGASGGLNGPDVGITFGPDGNFYVPSFWNSRITRYNGTTGAFMDTFVTPQSGGLLTPRTLIFKDNFLYVTDDFGDKILRYNATSGAFIDQLVTAGSGGLQGASGMILTDQNQLLVTSIGTDNVKIYDASSGTYQGDFFASGLAGVDAPTYIAAVPEPTLVLPALAALAALRRRKKKLD